MSAFKFVLPLLLMIFVSSAHGQKGGSGPNSKKYGFRIQYGFLDSNDSEFTDLVRTKVNSSVPAIKSPSFVSAEILYMPNDMVYGLRFEAFTSKKSANPGGINAGISDIDSELRGQRVNGLVGWRFLRIQQGYLGIISHFNLGYNTLNYEAVTTTGQGTKQTYTYVGDTSYGYGIALDGAYYADGMYPTGLEIGYTKYAAGSFKDSATGATVTGSSGQDLKADLSGMYFRFYVGFVF